MKKAARGSTKFSVSSGVFIGDAAGNLLLVQQADPAKGGKWGPPAGRMLIQSPEDPITTAKRETWEEINVVVELTGCLGVFTVHLAVGKVRLGFAFRGKIISGEIRPNRREIKDAHYFSLAEIQELTSAGKLYRPEFNRLALKRWEAGANYPLEIIHRVAA